MNEPESQSAVAVPPRLHPVVDGDLERIVERARTALERLRGKTVLVAGGAGFLASYLVDALLRSNARLDGPPCRVISVDNMLSGVAGRLAHLQGHPDLRLVEASVTELPDLGEPVHHIVHGASIASPSWYRRYPLETIDANVGGTRRLLELARSAEVDGFLLFSSSEIYGDPPPERIPTSETYWGHVSCTGPRAPYDESKRLAETLATTYHRVHGTRVVLIRPFNVYGPRLRLDDGRVVPDFLRDALAGQPITVHSDGRVTRSFCYVTDFVTAVLLLLVAGKAGEAYNVGNDEEVSIGDLAALVAELAPDAPVRHERSAESDYLTDNPSRRCPDLRKTKAATGWAPETDLRTGIARTLDSYRGGS